MKQFILILVAIIFYSEANSQAIQIGTGTAENTITQASPINTYFRRQVAHFVYTRQELNAAGISGANTLTQVGFFITTNPLFNIPGYTIKMKHTNRQNSNNLGTTGWTTVKNAFTYAPEPRDYDMIILDNPFTWNGTSNIAIEICWSQVQPTWDASGQCRIYNANNGYSYRQDDNGGSICGQTPNNRVNYKPQVQFIFKSTSTWNGSVNTDWFNPNNWDADVPTTIMNALIPAGMPNYPIITGSTAVCKDLTVSNGATLTLNAGANINVYANFNNNGTFVPSTGNLTFKGDVINNLNLIGTQNIYNLTVDNVNGANINSGNVNLTGTLNIGIATGNFNTNNALTLISDSAGTARINELTTKCKYTLNMFDSYGDSWNGAYITAYIDNVPVGDFYAKRSNSSSDIYVPTGSTLRLRYTAGIYENENSYTLSLNNTVIFNDGPTPSTGNNVFSTVATCTFFNPISGNITMQRYIDAGATNWRFIGSSVTGASIADLSSSFITSGFPGSDFPNWPTAANPWPSIYFYDESLPGAQSNGFTPPINANDVIGVGEGLWVWSGDTITGTQPFTVDVTGPPNVGNISLPLSYTNSGLPTDDGWNMLANPYPSSIDWDSPNISKIGVNFAIYIWNPDLQQFASYVAGFGTNGGSNIIASSQAIWVQAFSPTANVTFRETSKTSTTGSFLKTVNNQPFKMIATNANGSDELIINFNPSATNNFDTNLDAAKMPSDNTLLPMIASVMGNNMFSINQLPEQEINIPIKILTGVTGTHIIETENVSSLENISCLLLEDLQTGNIYNLKQINSINVTLYDTTVSARFLLHIGAPKNIDINEISCVNQQDGKIIFTKNSTSPFDITWRDANNNVVSSKNNILMYDTLNNLANGIYTIETTDALCGNTVDTVELTNPLPIVATFTTAKDTFAISEQINFNNQSTNAINYLWNFGDGNTSTLPSPTHAYMQPGSYLAKLRASQNSNCYQEIDKLITVSNTVVSVDEITSNEVKIWTIDNYIQIEFLATKKYTEVEIRDLSGKLIFSKNIANSTYEKINTINWSEAVYLVTLLNDKGSKKVKKVIIN